MAAFGCLFCWCLYIHLNIDDNQTSKLRVVGIPDVARSASQDADFGVSIQLSPTLLNEAVSMVTRFVSPPVGRETSLNCKFQTMELLRFRSEIRHSLTF